MKKKVLWIVALLCIILAGIGIAFGINKDRMPISEDTASESDADASDFQKESKKKEEEYREKTIAEKKETLIQDQGLYAMDSIVLQNTTKEDAERIAEEIGAEVRTTKAGDYAVLYLPEGVTIEDVYDNSEYAVDVTKMSPDYYISANELTDFNSVTLSDEDEGDDEDMPSIVERTVPKARPEYSVNDTGYDNQQYLDYIGLRDTWNTTKGNGITVAVIDSGIDTDHPEFAGKISDRSYNASEDKIVKDYDMSVIEDENGHGTAVSGVLCAAMNNEEGIVGVAPEINLLVIKCDIDESGEFVRGSDIIFGLAYAIETDVDIINMSFRSYEDFFSKYTKLAVDSDIICIASAGNDGSNIPVYPASLDSVIAVGAYDTETGEPTSYSNYGENVDILAPGTAYTTDLNGGYKMSTGTSISSPIAAGAAALYLAQNGKTEFDVMRQMFEASSIDLGILGEDYHNGFGEIDIHALVCEEKGTISYDMMTDEVENETQYFVKGHTIQTMPEPERLYLVYDGWFFDPNCTDECELYTNIFSEDVTLYANWVNEDDGTVFAYTTKSDNTIEIRAYTGKRRYITVPSTIDNKTVTSIGESAFADNSRIRSVILPQSITSINERAFVNCSMLREIEIPDNTVSIGNEAFSGCSRLGLVSISSNSRLASVGDSAFAYCGINKFDIPATLTSLGRKVFYGSTALRTVTVASGNSSFQIKNSALYDIGGTNLIYYPAALAGEYTVDAATTQIGEGAFAYSRSLSVILNEGLVNIGDEGFAYSKIRGFSIPESLESMGGSVCANCNYLSSISFAENGSITIISEYAFWRDNNLRYVIIPNYIRSIDTSAFLATGLVTVEFTENSVLKNIGMSAFSHIPIKGITIPDSVEVISGCAFSDDYSLSKVDFGENSNCTTILNNAFSYNYELKEFNIPDKVTLLGETVFYGSGIESIEIGASLTDIGSGSFANCKNLSYISVDSNNQKYTSYDGVLYNKDKTILMLFPAGKSGLYTLHDETLKIDKYAFSGADKLTEIVMNEGLKKIGDNAFEYCKSLNTPDLPSTLEEIDAYAFMSCISMSDRLLLPKKVKRISWYAFAYNYNLKVIDFEPECEIKRLGYGAFAYSGIEDFTIPRNVSMIDQKVFIGCKNLLAVTFESESALETLPAWVFDGADNLRRITFEDESELKQIEARACDDLIHLETVDFRGCTKLTTIDNYAFRNCISLNSLILPDTLKEIGRYAFDGCSSMNEMRLPEGLTSIGRYAFTNTDSINLYFLASVLPANLEDKWDYGIGAYYVGVNNVVETDDWIYALTSDGKASVIKYKGNATAINLNKIDGHAVVSIGSEAFKDNNTLASISLPETLTGIYKAAFSGTTSLDSITIPKNVSIIESEAFKDSGISEVSFAADSGLSTIGSSAFENTSNLDSISIPDRITEIRDNTFYKSNVKSVDLSNNTSSIGRMAFSESGLESISIPASVKEISYKAFKDAKALTTVTFADSDQDMMIRDEAFYGSGLTSVIVPANIKYIGNLCFSRCKNLTEINVDSENAVYASLDDVLYNKGMNKLITCPAGKTGSYTVSDNVSLFAVGAFEGALLSEIIIPDECSLQTIGHRTFYECDNLTSINIPDSVQSIEYYAFAYCDNLETVSINYTSNLGGIYEGAFYNCAKLGSIVIPDGVLEITDYAFYGCSELSEISFGENSQLRGIYDHAFEYSGIENFVMPKHMLKLGAYAFNESKLKNFEFNESLIEIGEYALANSSLNMKKIEIPNSVEYIGKCVLPRLDGIEELQIPFLGQTRHASSDTERNNATLKYLFDDFIKYPIDNSLSLKKVSITDGNVIGSYAFDGVYSIVEIIIPDTIAYIGSSAFSGCSRLKSVNIPDNVHDIFYRTFDGCGQLEEIVLPSGVESIGFEAFYSCSRLKEIFIPRYVNTIGENAFAYCSSLEKIDVDPNNTAFLSYDDILYSGDGTRIIVVPTSIKGEVNVLEGVTVISSGAFSSCKYIEYVSFPNTLITIEKTAFNNCTSLVEIKIPDSVVELGYNCFGSCKSLKRVELGAGLKTIGTDAFSSCTSLEYIEIPENVDNLGSYAFAGCTKLKYAIIKSKTDIIPEACFLDCSNMIDVVLPDTLKTIGYRAFRGCSAINHFVIPRNVSNIKSAAFCGCLSLEQIVVSPDNKFYKSVDGILYDNDLSEILFVPCKVSGNIKIPEGVKYIRESAFEKCTDIVSVVIPDSVDTIERSAFCGCTKLKSIQVGGNIKYIGTSVLSGTEYEKNEDNYYDGVLYLDSYAIGIKNKYEKEIRIREGTTVLADGLFSYSKLEKIYLPNSLIIIGSGTFSPCYNLKYVNWSDNIEYIGACAFYNTSIKDVCINNKNKVYVEEYAFYNCKDLKYIRIDNAHYDYSFPEVKATTCCGAKDNSFNSENVVFNNINDVSSSKSYNYSNVYVRLAKDKVDGLIHADPDNIHYLGEWNLSTFYVDGSVVSMLPLTNSEILRAPAENLVNEYLPEGATLIGWDIDNDGVVDDLPITLSEDLEAVAVYDAPIYRVSLYHGYKRKNNGSIIYDENHNPVIDYDDYRLEVGQSKTVRYQCYPRMHNHDDRLIWVSSDEACLTVDDMGKINAVSVPDEGYVTIRASLADNPEIYDETKVYISDKTYGIKLDETKAELNVDNTYQLAPEVVVPEGDTNVNEYISDEESIATVSDTGLITAVGPGIAYITIKHGGYTADFTVDVKRHLTNVSLAESEGTVNVGETIELSPVFEPVNTTDDKVLFWYSKDASVAKVSSDGIINGVAPGEAEIVGVVGKFKVTFTATVNAPIERITLNTSRGTLRLDHTKQLEVIYIPSNTTDDRTVTWSTDDPDIATVDENGLVTGITTGKTTITGQVGEHTATYEVSVIGLRDEATGITVTNSDDTEMEDGTSLNVDELDEDEADDLYNEYGNEGSLYGGIRLLIKDKHGRIYILYIYDISLYINQQTVQPGKLVDVDIPFPKGLIKENSHIYRMEVDGGLTEMDIEVHSGFFRFQTDHFSVYCVAIPTDRYEAVEVELEEDDLELCVGNSSNIVASVLPEAAEDKSLTYTSSDEAVATVDEDGKVTAVSEGTSIITVSSAVEGVYNTIDLAVIGHDWDEGEVTTDPTCVEAGVKTYHCKRKGCSATKTEPVSATGHSYGNEIAEVSATCTEDGMKAHYECSVCHKLFVKDGDEYIEKTEAELAIKATGHIYDQEVVDSKYRKSEADCMHAAVYYKSCKCGAKGTETFENGNPLGHAYGDEIAEAPATCTEDGMKAHYECSVCHKLFVKDGDEYVEKTEAELTIKATGHTYDQEVVDKEYLKSAADCTHAAVYFKSCKCGTKGTDTFENGKPLGHDYHDVDGTAKDPTCTEDGKEADQKCSRCDSEITGKIIKANGHSYGDEIAEVSATCTEDGMKAHYECSVCHKLFVKDGDEYVEKTEAELTIKATGHTYDQEVVDSKYLKSVADCTHAAVYYKSCKCGAKGTETFENGKPLGHDYHDVDGTAKEPTCIEDGKEADQKCSRCDSEITGKTIKATGHSYDDEIAEAPATCTEDGMKAHYECSVCHKLFVKDGDEYIEKTEAELTIKATGHTYDQEVVDKEYLKSAADCTHAAVYFKSCKCGAKGTETFENGKALGHDYHDVDGTAKEPTCTEDGKEADQKCSRCDFETTGKTIKATGHSYGDEISEVSATCTEDGMKAHYECSVCYKLFVKDGDEYIEKTEAELTIKATGHTYDEEVVDSKYLKSAADCTHAAIYFKSCKCGAKGTETFESGKPLGHDWDEGVITKEPTKKEDGIKTFTCRRCEATRTEPVKYEGGDEPEVIHVTGVTLNMDSVNILKGDMVILKATVSPKNAAKKTVKWSSSNSKIASVDQNGAVTALQKGNATITVTTDDGGYTAKCKVTVIDDSTEPDDPEPVDPSTDSVTMYRLYNPNSGEHFYSSSQSEIDTIVAAGWKNEGVAWKAPKKSQTPVYRLYNPNAGDHHYTTSEAEKDNLIEVGWKYEGIGWYSDDNKGIALHRLYNPNATAGSHHYTTSLAEKDNLVTVGWKYEGTAWYGMK